MKILNIVGTRPNLMSTAPLCRVPELWDRHTAERIVDILLERLLVDSK